MPNAVAALDPAVGEDWKLPLLHPAPSPPKPPEPDSVTENPALLEDVTGYPPPPPPPPPPAIIP